MINITDPEIMKYYQALNAVWATGHWSAAIDLAWRWNSLELLTANDLINFAKFKISASACKTDPEEIEREIKVLKDFIDKCEQVKAVWGDYD